MPRCHLSRGLVRSPIAPPRENGQAPIIHECLLILSRVYRASRDWRKPDLSINVIAFAAQGIKTINLYWSGNATVLEGWKHSICDGPSRPKDLKKIILHASPVSTLLHHDL